MLADIFFSWNELTMTLVAWLGVMSLALGIDFGPQLYRENRARAQLVRSIAMAAERKAAAPTLNPEETMQLGVFQINPATVQRRRHAKV